MSTAIVIRPQGELLTVTAIVADAGDGAARRFLEFFTATIRNTNTRRAYGRAVVDFLPDRPRRNRKYFNIYLHNK
jgi:hypothetical protein